MGSTSTITKRSQVLPEKSPPAMRRMPDNIPRLRIREGVEYPGIGLLVRRRMGVDSNSEESLPVPGSEPPPDWWPELLRPMAAEDPWGSDPVVIAEISEPWGEGSYRQMFT